MNTIENPPRDLANVRAAIYGQPWAITEQWLEKICTIAQCHIEGKQIEFVAKDSNSNMTDSGFQMENNVAIIPVSGPIFPKANLMTELSGATSLVGIQSAMSSAAGYGPSAIILNMDSPGGAVSGMADFCEWFKEFQSEANFPVIAFANPLCASAAYWIASQCSQVFATGGATVGSIGVMAAIDDTSRAKKNSGNDSIVLRSSELKGAGNGAVTPNQIQDMQRVVMAHDAKFKSAVKSGRSGIDMDKVGTGQVWQGQSANSDPSALDLGLIDGISTLENLVARYGEEV